MAMLASDRREESWIGKVMWVRRKGIDRGISRNILEIGVRMGH